MTLSIDTAACSFEGRNNDPMAPADDPSYFRQLLGERYLPDIDNWPDNAGVILQAYHSETGFPADRVLSDAGQKLPLYLKSGNYRVTLHDLDGNLLWEKRIGFKMK